ncbi:MAG: hypothetical protein WCL29_03440 [Pseudomonadota bacterium]
MAKRRHLHKSKNQSKIRFILAAFNDRLQIFGFTVRLARVVVLHFVYYRYLPSELAVSENDRRFPYHCGELITLAVDLRNCAGDHDVRTSNSGHSTVKSQQGFWITVAADRKSDNARYGETERPAL